MSVSADSCTVQQIPLLFVHGTHYEVGFQLGRTFEGLINDYYQEHRWLSTYEEFYATDDGKQFCEGFWTLCRQRYPHYMDELLGMADGSHVPLQKVMLMNLEREITGKLGLIDETLQHEQSLRCTDVLINNSNVRLIGHNEDWFTAMRDKDAIICADILPYQSDDGRVFAAERFVAHIWPGVLIGMNSSFNMHGVVFSIDHLVCHSVQTNSSTAELFLCRSLLAARSTEEMWTLLTDDGYGVSYGFCINYGSVTDDQLYSVEVLHGDSESRQSTLGVCRVIADTLTSPPQLLPSSAAQVITAATSAAMHSNNVQYLKDTDSVTYKKVDVRIARFASLSSLPADARDAMDYLADDAVFVSPDCGLAYSTATTVLLDLRQQTMSIYKCRTSDVMATPTAVLPFSMLTRH